MRIGVDLRPLEGGAMHRGIGRVIVCLVETLSQIDHQNEYILFLSSKRIEPPELRLHKDFKFSFAYGKAEGLRGVKYVRAAYVLKRPLYIDRYKLDVFLQIDPIARVRSKYTPIVSVIHDLIPFLYKETYQKIHLTSYWVGGMIAYTRHRLFWYLYENAIRDYHKSQKIVSISAHTKQDLLEFEPRIPHKHIHPVLLAAFDFPEASGNPSSEIARLAQDDFLFYIGGADPRKGLVGLTKSMEDLWKKHPDVRLVLAGKEVIDPDVPEAVKLAKAVKQSSHPDKVTLLGRISDADLAFLYHKATAFVFPSSYEGFGLPVLEAMKAGCPVVAYSNSSIPEVAGDAALLVRDGESLIPAIEKVLTDKSVRAKMIRQGKKQAAKFTWEKTAKETLVVLRKAANENRN